MKRYFWIMTAGIWLLAGCAHFQNPFPNLIETQARLVTGCDMLGTVAETANADTVSVYMAKRAMVNNVKKRAAALGATHIVWLHRTDASAVAQAYRCPQPEQKSPEPKTDEAAPTGPTQ